MSSSLKKKKKRKGRERWGIILIAWMRFSMKKGYWKGRRTKSGRENIWVLGPGSGAILGD